LQSVDDRGRRLYPHFGDLCLDLYAALYKTVLVDRPAAEVARSAALGRGILRTIRGAAGFVALRGTTLLDEGRAAAGVRVLARQALEILRDEEVVSAEELARTADLARQEREVAETEEALAETDEALPSLGEEARRRLERLADETAERRARSEEAARELPDLGDLPASAESRLRQAVDALPSRIDRAEEEAESWGRGVGTGTPVSSAERIELGEKVAASEALRHLARLAGAFREFARAERRRRIARRATEVHDVGLGGDWARALPAELACLRHPQLGRALRLRALEGRMQVVRLEGPDDRGRGPLVVCLDGSGSMQGQRDLWGKAVALALADIARRQRRACRVISFSDSDKALAEFDLLPARRRGAVLPRSDAGALVRMAEHFPGGGTDFVLPLRRALTALDESSYRRGDVVFVTDGEASVPPAVVEEVAAARRRLGCHVYGVWVDLGAPPTDGVMHPGPEVLASFCDDVTTVSRLTADSVRDLFLKI
jgi:uncharacterized protein with von Willebrand factor type A (vWA) domain